MSSICGIVLAAGKSTRMGAFNKLTSYIAGHPMVWYPVDHLRKARCPRIIAVIGHDRTNVKRSISEGVEWVIQEEQRGTGHAVAQVLPALSEEHVIVLYGDCPFLDADIIEETVQTHLTTGADATLATAKMREPRLLGRVFRSADGRVEQVISAADLPTIAAGPSEVFAGLSVWTTDFLRKALPGLPIHRRQESRDEQELPDAIITDGGGCKIAAYSEISEDDALGPNTPAEFEQAAAYLQVKINANLRGNGVILTDSHTIRADYDVIVAPGSVLHANTYLLGRTQVGESAEIGPNSPLNNCTVGARCRIGRGSWQDQVFPDGSRASDRLATEHSYFRRPHFMIPEDETRCFIMMQFTEPYSSLLGNVIRPALDAAGFFADVASERSAPGAIIDDVWEAINRASLVIAEISQPNRNVWYELGLAHALNKPVVMLMACDSGLADLPFDTRHLRTLIYDPHRHDLRKLLDSWIADFKLRRRRPDDHKRIE
jgi:bifunctional UDP-N-acetylglucosamine pyrophosphorylase/glucosamine-1-phosphate N-acetyltransferase